MVRYLVKNKPFNNIYLALYQVYRYGGEIKLYCFDHEYDQLNWLAEPAQSLDDLMTAHAVNLRNKFDRLVLLWSGGTDSHTIYQVFQRAGLHIDQIIVKYCDHTKEFPLANAEWLLKNHWDKNTKLTLYDDFDSQLKLIDLKTDNWVWEDRGDRLKYGLSPVGDAVNYLCEREHSGHTWIAIAGYDKPRIVYRKGHWYSLQLDSILRPAMGNQHIEFFFLEPMINLKQSHLIKNATKKLIKHQNLSLYDGDWGETKWPKSEEWYRLHSLACGRHDEINQGVSYVSKLLGAVFQQNEISVSGNWKNLKKSFDIKLIHDLNSGEKPAELYLKGLWNIQYEKGFSDWLYANGWLKTNRQCLTDLEFIWSKEYDLGT